MTNLFIASEQAWSMFIGGDCRDNKLGRP